MVSTVSKQIYANTDDLTLQCIPIFGKQLPSGGSLGEWVYRSQTEQYVEEPEPDDLIESRTPGAIQKNWKTPSEFPLCPSEIGLFVARSSQHVNIHGRPKLRRTPDSQHQSAFENKSVGVSFLALPRKQHVGSGS